MKTKITKEGWMVLDGDTHISKWIEESGLLCHDQFLPYVATKHMKPGDVVMDVGSFIGDHTIAYSEVVGRAGIVFAVEAGQLSFECLEHNAKLFPIKNTVCVRMAVSDVSWEFVTHNADTNLGASFLTESKTADMSRSAETITIDHLVLIYDIKSLEFIKMDIEGCEVKALRGARESLKKFRPIMLLEVSSCALERQGFNKWDLIAEVTRHGYGFEIVEPQCTIYSPEFNILCKPL